MGASGAKRRITDDLLRNIIIKRLPKLLEKEPPLKEYLANLIAERFADKKTTEEEIKELLAIIKEQNKKFEEQSKVLAEHSRILAEHSKTLAEHSKRLEEHSKRLEEHSVILQELLREVKSLRRDYDRTLSALGTRWGLYSELSFRNGMRAILESELGLKVERYCVKDEEGEVFGWPDQVELDLVIRNGKLIVVEIKSSASKSDINIFWRKIRFYEKREGVKVDRAIFISPMVDPRGLEAAKRVGIEVYTWPEDVKLEEEV